MVITSLLKRRDSSSVIVAIFVAYGLLQLISTLTSQPTAEVMKIFGVENGSQFGYPTGDWKVNYLTPIVTFVLQVLALELITRAYIYVTNRNQKPATKRKK